MILIHPMDPAIEPFASGVTFLRDGEKQVSWNPPTVHRVGGYVVTHSSGQIVIDMMWSETCEDRSGQSCLLLYDPDMREPQRISVQKSLPLLFIRLV
ncbi:hypothetical protein BB934_31060 (plasmid) [Microvirga ossetica]|uniref:Uncharacterized protein n=1 Tax=Microvirga ossetica TaxID=1882682 RepID=A0A1B2ERW0_9HYPH|nr:hypothetical protein [Microvirga ossetica]ANY82699.1 hypothetical protein BB934_31060 [Microvirga ossetica]